MADSRVKDSFVYQNSKCTIVTDKPEAIQTAKEALIRDLWVLNQFVKKHPEWNESFEPIEIKNAPEVAKTMEEIGYICGVGPMAAVAGVLADRMQEKMIQKHHAQIAVVENGGEIAIESSQDVIIGLDVLTTTLKSKLGFRFEKNSQPMGVGTSSGQFGHAFSFGDADAVTVFAKSAGLADAAATKICNAVVGEDYKKSVENALPLIREIHGAHGVIIAREGFVGKKGIVPELIRIKDE